MEKLKTLKDIRWLQKDMNDVIIATDTEELKKEAINWIKMLEIELDRWEEECEDNCPIMDDLESDDCPIINDNVKKCKFCKGLSHDEVMENISKMTKLKTNDYDIVDSEITDIYAIIAFIKHFFNITDKDLE